jgi:hypothetical protein
VALDELCLAFGAQSLKDLGEHHIGERDRLATLDQLDAAHCLGRIDVVEDVDPDARVDDDHRRRQNTNPYDWNINLYLGNLNDDGH